MISGLWRFLQAILFVGGGVEKPPRAVHLPGEAMEKPPRAV